MAASGRTATKVRFIIVSLISLRAQQLLGVAADRRPLELGPAWPILPMLFVTPAVTFLLNRQWVFR